MTIVPEDVLPLIPRSQMPQVHESLVPELLVFLGTKGLSFTAGFINPNELKLHQEIDLEKAKNLTPEVLRSPILLSVDIFVIDGDHRSYRHMLDKTQVPYIMILASFDKAVATIFEFNGTYKTKTTGED